MNINHMDNANLRTSGSFSARPPEGKFSFGRMSLQTRLVLLLLVISIPVIVLSNLLLTFQAQRFIRQDTQDKLAQTNAALVSKAATWLSANTGVLNQLASLDDVRSMDPEKQIPLLQGTSAAFPQMFLVHTLNTSGFNVARNDAQANRDYSDREWFQEALAGAQLSEQVIISRTINQPALSLAAPVKDHAGKVVGVLSVVSDLTEISKEVLTPGIPGTETQSLSFIVDPTNHVIAHPDPAITENVSELADFSSYPPVAVLREGRRGAYEFTDEQGRVWLSDITMMDNGWGVITQVDMATALAPISLYWRTTLIIIALSSVLLAGLALLTVRRSMRPMSELAETVKQITAGNLNLEAKVTSQDEVGQLAQAFNAMTAQVRENIGSLESRVAERTRALILSAEVSRRLSTILNLDQLTREVATEIQQAFQYYHVHIYLFDESRANLVMVGGSGEAGQVMLARGHKLQAGRGLVGRAASSNLPVLVTNTAEDPGWLPNPLLPNTRSELAVPIAIGDSVMGVLDVQQNVVGGLSLSDVEMIQSVANQVAVAVQNARAFSDVKQAAQRDELISTIGLKIQRATSIDEVLRVAVSELGQALGGQLSTIELRSQAALKERSN